MTTAALSTTMPTLLDAIKRKNPDGTEAKIIELLKARDPMLEDMVVLECNGDDGHLLTQRTSLPSITAANWRAINQGVPIAKSTTGQLTEVCGCLETYSAIDKALVDRNGPGFRLSEDAGHLMALKNEINTGLVYHSTLSAPRKFMGLAPRYAATTGTAGSQIILADSGASGNDQTSVWGVVWGDGSVNVRYPKGTSGGVTHEDKGQMTWDATDSTLAVRKVFEAYVSHFKWELGLVVEDWRQAVRVGNIDTSALVSDAASGADVIESMIRAYHKLFAPSAGRLAWYCNRTVGTYLHLQALNKTSNTLTIENVGGKPVTFFLGAPVRETDAITDTESVLS